MFSVVQWHPFSLSFGGCPTKMVFPKKGSLFFQGHWTTECLTTPLKARRRHVARISSPRCRTQKTTAFSAWPAPRSARRRPTWGEGGGEVGLWALAGGAFDIALVTLKRWFECLDCFGFGFEHIVEHLVAWNLSEPR